MMKYVLALLLATSGCFTSWAITQGSGNQRLLDEGVRTDEVPLPGVRERLHVRMPFETQLSADAEPRPFAFECTSTQSARNTVYHSGFRYGRRWKIAAAVMFALEAGVAAAYYFGSDRDRPANQLAIGAASLDALGTAALFFVPRKEIFRNEEQGVYEQLRTDCPAGLIFEIGGESFPVDAAGRIGELGEAALDVWMLAPTAAPVRLTYHDRVLDLALGQNEVCTWKRLRHQDQSTCPAYWSAAPAVAASIEVPMGTLTQRD
jgi:hypothetical protein